MREDHVPSRVFPSCSKIALIASVAISVVTAVHPSLLAAQSPGNPADVKSDIARIETRWLHAIETSDVSILNSILADDFIRPAPSAGDFITKSQLLAYYKTHKPSASGLKHIENLQVNVYGTTAIARGNVVSTDTSRRELSRTLFTDVFILRGGLWQAVSAQENKLKDQ
jgi:hypothetical protein